MKKLIFVFLVVFASKMYAQTTITADYKIVNIGDNGYGDYTRALILLHEIYNGTLINHNYAIGTITAMRGNSVAFNRINVVTVNTSSAYNGTSGSLNSADDNATWKLKTCVYNNKKYIAVEIPYSPAHHDWGYWFSGATSSTAENMKCVAYEVNGAPVNQSILSNILDFSTNIVETHEVAVLNITGNVGIGTSTPHEALSVNGTIRSREVKVETTNWPDYVFKPTYQLPKLSEVKSYIDQNQHLPDMPSEIEVKKDGINLGEMVKLQTKKIEELTLYVIEKDKQLDSEHKANQIQQSQIDQLKQQLQALTKEIRKN